MIVFSTSEAKRALLSFFDKVWFIPRTDLDKTLVLMHMLERQMHSGLKPEEVAATLKEEEESKVEDDEGFMEVKADRKLRNLKKRYIYCDHKYILNIYGIRIAPDIFIEMMRMLTGTDELMTLALIDPIGPVNSLDMSFWTDDKVKAFYRLNFRKLSPELKTPLRLLMEQARDSVYAHSPAAFLSATSEIDREEMLSVMNNNPNDRYRVLDLHYLHKDEVIQEVQKAVREVVLLLREGMKPSQKNGRDHILKIVLGVN
jgi:hypothetical protein